MNYGDAVASLDDRSEEFRSAMLHTARQRGTTREKLWDELFRVYSRVSEYQGWLPEDIGAVLIDQILAVTKANG